MIEYIPTNVEKTDVLEIKKIELETKLESWSVKDYLLEVERFNSIFLKIQNTETGEIIGFILARIQSDIEEKTAEIYNLAVIEGYRRMGIARKLFKAFLFKSVQEGISKYYLEVRESNKNAIDFYQRLGFQILSVRKNLYMNPLENGLLMFFSDKG